MKKKPKRLRAVLKKVPIVAAILPPDPAPPTPLYASGAHEPPPTYHEPDPTPAGPSMGWAGAAIFALALIGWLMLSKACPPVPVPPPLPLVGDTPTATATSTATPTPSPEATMTATGTPSPVPTPSRRKARCADGKVMRKGGCPNICKDGVAVGNRRCEGK